MEGRARCLMLLCVCVQATKVLEGLLPDEQVPQHHHSRRNHDPDTEDIPQVRKDKVENKKAWRLNNAKKKLHGSIRT